jgi:crotonobetainyl-CoA:carnitine CoA-transferase CaiB-like acyl-CoA transferase
MGGIMSLTGAPDGEPQKVGVPVADLFAGLYGCIGVLAALRHKEQTGAGQLVDIGMLDTHVAWLANQGMNFLATGQNPTRLGNQHPNIVPYQVFATADGHMVLSIGNDATFAKFCKNFGIEPLLADPRFATNAARVGNRQLVTDTLAETMRTQTTGWWIKRLEALQIGCGPINTLDQVFSDPQVVARGNVIEMEHVSGTPMKLIANPVRLSETPADYRLAPPSLGQHTNDVLGAWLGLDEAALNGLRTKNII